MSAVRTASYEHERNGTFATTHWYSIVNIWLKDDVVSFNLGELCKSTP